MGSALSTAPTQLVGIEQCLPDIDNGDHIFDENLRSTRFLKTARTKYLSTMKVVKVFVKQDQTMDLKPYINEIERIHGALERNHNVQTFRKPVETDRAGFLVRQYFFSNLYDRMATRPMLNMDEKRWIVFQLFQALHGCHTCQVCHGDIKIENVCLTSWNWVFLSDFASFKPTHLPVDNPAAFSYFFDTSGRSMCNIAPERFYQPETSEGTDSHICRFDGKLLPPMDIFSLGCVIYELIMDGKPLFTLSTLLAYREHKLDVTPLLAKIADQNIRELILHMIHIDPSKRLSATEYLQRNRGKVFPHVFYTSLHRYMLQFVAAAPMSPDQKVIKLKKDFASLCAAFDKDATLTESGNRLLIIGSVLTACIRSLTTTTAKLVALEVLTSLCSRVLDEHKIDRFLPYIIVLLGDHIPLVRVKAIRVMAAVLSEVINVQASDLNLFPEYIIPHLAHLKSDPEVVVRAAYAEQIALLAETAQRFLETAQLAIMNGKDNETDGIAASDSDSDQSQFSFDLELNTLRDIIQDEVVTIMTDPESVVKQTILSNNISKLCAFLGPQRASDVLLSHMLTFFNDKRDWRLRAVFFDSIVGVATYCGSRSMEFFILPLMEKYLADREEFVVKQALGAMAASVELKLFQRNVIIRLTMDIAPLLQHPSVWIRCAAVNFISAVAKNVSTIDLHCTLIPVLKNYLLYDCIAYHEGAVVMSVLGPSLSRELYLATVSIPDIEILYDALLVRKVMRGEGNVKSKKMAKVQKHQDVINLLSTRGLTASGEELLLRLELYIRKVWREYKSFETDPSVSVTTNYRVKLKLRDSGIQIHDGMNPTRGVTSLAPATKRNRSSTAATSTDKATGRKATANFDVAMLKNVVTGHEVAKGHIEVDVETLTKEKAARQRMSQPPIERSATMAVKGKKAQKAIADARDRDANAMRTWRPEGKMVGHLHEHKKAVNQLLVSPTQQYFASCADDGFIKIWDCSKLEGKSVTNQSRQQFHKQGTRVKKIEIFEGGQTIASAIDDMTVNLTRIEWNSSTFNPLAKRDLDPTTDGQAVDIKSCGANSPVLVYATARGQIHGWDTRTNKDAWSLSAPTSEGLISDMAIDPQQSWLSYGTSRGIYMLYDLRYLLKVKSWRDPRQSSIGSLALYPPCAQKTAMTTTTTTRNPDWDPQSWVISSSGANDASVWDMKTSQITTLFCGTPTAQELDLTQLQGPVNAANARNAVDVTKIAPPKTAKQLFEDDQKRLGDKSTLSRRQWLQLSSKEKGPYISRAAQDVTRHEDIISSTLANRWTAAPLRSSVTGIRAICTHPGNSAAYLGGSDGHIRVWDLEKPYDSYILGETRPSTSANLRVDLQTRYDVVQQGAVQILKENLGYEARARANSNASTTRGPVAPNHSHGNGISSLALVTSPDKFLLSSGRDGVIKIWR